MTLNYAQLIGGPDAGGLLDGFRNRIINGNMRIDQRQGGATVNVNGSGTFTIDRWYGRCFFGGTPTLTFQQVTDAPTGFSNSLRATVATPASGAPTAGQYASVTQPIEGFNMADLGFGSAGAKPFTLSFWVKCSLTGQFGLGFGNSANNRGYATSYTINSANTWEYKTVTVLGDTIGTWDKTNGRGVVVIFGLGIGSDFTTSTTNTWLAAEIMSPTGMVNFIQTGGATFQITGVQLEVGEVASEFERRSYGTELGLCQRYYQLMHCYDRGNSATTTVQGRSRTFLTEMRTSPIITPIINSNGNVASTIYDVLTGFGPGRMGLYYTITVTAAGNYTLSERISLSAEL